MKTWGRILVCLVFALAACGDPSEASERIAPSAASASATPEATPGRCEHGLTPAVCPQCTPALAAVYQARGDWCEEHGLPESICPICHPGAKVPEVGAAPASDDWCGEHRVPESKCTQCNRGLIATFRAAGDYCETHGFPESVCPVCNPQAPPAGAEQSAIEARVVRFRSPDIERSAGIETVAAESGRASPAIDCTARIAFDADHLADVRAIVPGIVRRVRVEMGAKVLRGAPLFELESTRVGEIQGALLAAHQRVRTAQTNLARQRELRASDIASARQVEVAEQELATAQAEARTAEATLSMAGAAPSSPSGRYTLTAPIAGTVVRRPAVVGLLATESESLATVADTSVMWAFCDVPEAQASRVALGQRVVVRVEGSDDAPLLGSLTWISSEVDVRTRTVPARAEVRNEGGLLRANQFARARIETGASRVAVTVPRGAVQRVGKREVVFVRTSQGVYEPRIVERSGDGERVHVSGRIEAGEAVVTTGAVLLRTEITPGSIGAGCCEVTPPGGS